MSHSAIVKQARKDYRKKQTVGKSNKILATRSFVKKAIKTHNELKEHVIASSRTTYNALADTVWEQNALCAIAQGDSDANRDGDKIEVTFIDANTNILLNYADNTMDPDAELNPVQIRVVMYQCKRGVTPANALSYFPTTGALAPLSFQSLRAIEVLYDRVFTQNDFQSTSVETATVAMYKYPQLLPVRIKRKPKITIPIWFQNPSGVSPDLIGAIMLAYCVFHNGVAGTAPTVSVLTTPDSRITFRDK